jgi:P27 family predicted phage terminase small subunit
MGKRGPAPKPTRLRLLHGDRASRVNTEEPDAPDGVPLCPPEVADDVRRIWDYTMAQLAVMNLATPADRDALLCYCEAVAIHRKASELLARSSVIIKGLHGGLVRNPAVQIQRDAAAAVRAFAGEFGLTPSARSEIRTGGQAKESRAERYMTG